MTRSLTTEEYLKRAKSIHGAKFDYSKIEYKDSKTNILINCKTHGDFLQLPNAHLKSPSGCPKCETIRKKRRYSLGKEKFIQRARDKHGFRYDYNDVVYVNSKTNVKIRCKEHGIFEQRPETHVLRGQGCPKCAGRGLNREEWINRFKRVHGERYDYSKFEYKGATTYSTIICRIHGEFRQRPNNHYNTKSGCRKCAWVNNAKNRALGKETFVDLSKQRFGDKFNYDKVVYANNNTKVEIECKNHGIFTTTPNVFLNSKFGCFNCANELQRTRKYTTEEWITKAIQAHDSYYDYSDVEYTSGHDKVSIKCPKHGLFKQSATNHLKGIGCWECYKDRVGESTRHSLQTIIHKSKEIHGEYYDYSKSKYVNYRTPMEIVCPKHGSFFQSPSLHISQKCGCSSCAQYGYDVNKTGWYYVHTITNEQGDTLYTKGGISNSPDTRFERWRRRIRAMPRHKNHNVNMIHRVKFESGQDALEFEKILLDIEEIKHPDVPGMRGGTELFWEDPLIYAIEVLGYNLKLEYD